MKTLSMATIAAVIGLTLFTTVFTSCSAASKNNEGITPENGFAVLELFTSEGCSSCPPADALMARIQKEVGNKPIYILAYHVDYWNHLGWKDIFSSPQYSERQQQYSQKLSASVYTPQLIVNGRVEYVGSNESSVTTAIQKALNDSTDIKLEIKGQLQSGKINLDYQISGNIKKHNQLLVALVQKQAVSKVQRGENKGRTLTHVQVVRDLQTFNIKKDNQGSVMINLPQEFNTQDSELIAMVQNPETFAIKAVTRINIRVQ